MGAHETISFVDSAHVLVSSLYAVSSQLFCSLHGHYRKWALIPQVLGDADLASVLMRCICGGLNKENRDIHNACIVLLRFVLYEAGLDDTLCPTPFVSPLAHIPLHLTPQAFRRSSAYSVQFNNSDSSTANNGNTDNDKFHGADKDTAYDTSKVNANYDQSYQTSTRRHNTPNEGSVEGQEEGHDRDADDLIVTTYTLESKNVRSIGPTPRAFAGTYTCMRILFSRIFTAIITITC